MTPRLAARPAALFDLTGRAAVALSGKDRAALLQGLVTNDVKGLAPGTGCHAALLTPKGKMAADLVVLVEDGRLLLDAERELAEVLAKAIAGYVFFQEVTVADETAATAVLHVEGRDAAEALARAGLSELPSVPHAHRAAALAGAALRVVAECRGGATGFDLRCARADAPSVADALGAAGIAGAPLGLLEASRVEAGIPRWGAELGPNVLPNEALLERDAISYTKGCYIGQETVARIRTYGHVNRLLVRLAFAPGAPVSPGDALLAGEGAVGAITSVARDGGAALGYVKRERAAEGVLLSAGGHEAAVHPLG